MKNIGQIDEIGINNYMTWISVLSEIWKGQHHAKYEISSDFKRSSEIYNGWNTNIVK